VVDMGDCVCLPLRLTRVSRDIL